jgi:hypothetical protein
MFGNITVYVTLVSFLLSGCVATMKEIPIVGPKLSSTILEKENPAFEAVGKQFIDVAIPSFDPGIPADQSKWEELGVWPELRNAEANRFAWMLKEKLEEESRFGAVRVVPDLRASSDLYVQGTIEQSNGRDLKLKVLVTDSTGRKWGSKSFNHEVPDKFHETVRNENKDAYEPVFKKISSYVVKLLKKRDDAKLAEIKKVTDIRFAASYLDEKFQQYLAYEDSGMLGIGAKAYKLTMLPSDTDPMYKRVQAIKVRDQLFIDNLQSHYSEFSEQMGASYLEWQEQSHLEALAVENAKSKATGDAIVGVLLLGLAVAAAGAGGNPNDKDYSVTKDATAAIGAVAAGVAGAAMIGNSFKKNKEAKIHADALEELGQSVDIALSPQVVEFEEKTQELTGDAKEQFTKWRVFLKEIYAVEKTPEVQL